MLLEVFDVLQNTMLKNLVYKYLSTSCIIFRLDSQNWKYWVEDMKCDEHSDNELVHILKYFCAEILWSEITVQRICSFYFMYVCFFKRVGFPVIFPVCKKKMLTIKNIQTWKSLRKKVKITCLSVILVDVLDSVSAYTDMCAQMTEGMHTYISLQKWNPHYINCVVYWYFKKLILI